METPQFFQGSPCYYNTTTHQFSPEKRHSDSKTGDHFIIEDLLDFPTDDVVAEGGDTVVVDVVAGTPTDTSTLTTAVDSCNSSLCGGADPNFAGDGSFADAQFSNLSVPYDDLAELEWLSNFVEESFSSEDLQKLQLISGVKTANRTNNTIFDSDMAVPAKARTKRSRAAPCNWTSRVLAVSPAATVSSESDFAITSSSPGKKTPLKKKEVYENSSHNGDGRKCLHCATDKTPQWRTGPMGPKTLCNACGVRYKSGRLVPEYRPAASPTFVLTKHSNSHRKVLELRRQKEMQTTQQQQQQQFLHHQNMMFDVSNGDDYLIHQHIGPDYRQLL